MLLAAQSTDACGSGCFPTSLNVIILPPCHVVLACLFLCYVSRSVSHLLIDVLSRERRGARKRGDTQIFTDVTEISYS